MPRRTAIPDFNVDYNRIFKKKWKAQGTMYFFYLPDSNLMAAVTRDDKTDSYYEVSLFVTHSSGRNICWSEDFEASDESEAITIGKNKLYQYFNQCINRIKKAELNEPDQPKSKNK